MELVFTIAGAVLVLLAVTKTMFGKMKILPLGGSEPSQMAIVLGLAFVVHEIMRVVH